MRIVTRGFVASLAWALCLLVAPIDPAEACGLKLVANGVRATKSIRPSVQPSHILILGRGNTRVESALSTAGHRVDVAQKADAASSSDYRVVLVEEPAQAEAARMRWPAANVLEMMHDPYRNVSAVEHVLERAPVDAMPAAKVIASKGEDRELVSAGPNDVRGQGSVLVAAGNGDAVGRGEATQASPSARTAPSDARPRDYRLLSAGSASDRTSASQPASPKASSASNRDAAITFAFGSDALSSATEKRLAGEASWLKENPGTALVLEGHQGPTEHDPALGQRRADAAARYIINLGIERSRVTARGYGPKPATVTHDEEFDDRAVVIQRLGEGQAPKAGSVEH